MLFPSLPSQQYAWKWSFPREVSTFVLQVKECHLAFVEEKKTFFSRKRIGSEHRTGMLYTLKQSIFSVAAG